MKNPVNVKNKSSQPPDYFLLGKIIFICLIVFGLVGYYLGKQSTQIKISGQITPTLAPVSTIFNISDQNQTVDTSNWKTYKNEKYGFKINYPPNVKLIPKEALFNIFISNDEYPFGMSISIDVLPNPSNLILQEVGNNKFATDASEPYDLNWQTSSFSGKPAIKTIYFPPGDTGNQSIYLFSHNENIIAVWYSSVDKEDSSEFSSLSNNILSTFQFLDQNQTPNITKRNEY